MSENVQSKLIQELKDGYQAIAQQFSLYTLLDRYETLLLEHKPYQWQSDYNVIVAIKKQITLGVAVTEGYTDGGLLKADDGKVHLSDTSCIKLFE